MLEISLGNLFISKEFTEPPRVEPNGITESYGKLYERHIIIIKILQ